AARCATLLAVPVGEQRAFPGNAVDVGSAVAHNAKVVGAEVEPSDVISPDDQDVRLLLHLSNFLCHEGALLFFCGRCLSQSFAAAMRACVSLRGGLGLGVLRALGRAAVSKDLSAALCGAARLEFCPWLLGMVVVLAQHCVFLRSTDLRRRACSAC